MTTITSVESYLFVALFLGACGLVYLLAPSRSRRDIFFATTVSPGFRMTPPGQHIERRYGRRVCIHMAIGVVLGEFGACFWNLPGPPNWTKGVGAIVGFLGGTALGRGRRFLRLLGSPRRDSPLRHRADNRSGGHPRPASDDSSRKAGFADPSVRPSRHCGRLSPGGCLSVLD